MVRTGALRAALAVSLVAPALVSAPHADGAVSGTARDIDDRDGNDVVDSFDDTLAGAVEDRAFDVIVMLNRAPSASVLKDQQDDVGDFEVDEKYGDLNAYVATMIADQVEDLAARPDVKAVYENSEVHATLDTATSEFGVVKARTDFLVDGGDGVAGYSKDDAVVAVIDTGINATHDDLDGGKVLAFADFIGGGCDDTPTTPAAYDDNGHGTHVSSIAAGEGQLNARAVGVAPGAALVGVKVLNSVGSGSTACVANGIKWVIDNRATYGIEIINMSLGDSNNGSGNDPISLRVNEAVAAGITVVVAAGNDGPAVGTVGSPGVARDAVTVGAMTDPADAEGSYIRGYTLASFSSRGPTLDGRIKPDVGSAGADIFAAVPGGTYGLKSGTSMASPFVAGVAALMLDADPSLTPALVKAKLKQTSVDWGPAGEDNDYGAGRLDAHAALDAASGSTGSAPAVPEHRYATDCLTGTGDVDDWSLTVPSATWPIATTLVMAGTGGGPNVNLRLYAPNGLQVATSTGSTRQEAIGYQPTTTGTYTLRVESASGGGSYSFDASGPTGVAGGADGCSAPAPASSPPTTSPPEPVSTPAPAPAPVPEAVGDGYVLIDDKGGLFSFGNAPFLGSVPGLRARNAGIQSARIAGAFPTHGGAGYIAYDEDGRAFAFGAARNLGSVHDRVRARQIPAVRVVAAFATNGGDGYVMVDSGGGVHTFGAAPYHGSVADLRAAGAAGPAEIVGGFAVQDGAGYVLIDNVGGLFAFGHAPFHGSVPALRSAGHPIGPARIVGGFSVADGAGYVMIDDVGGLFAFGSAPFHGSVPALRDAGVPIGPARIVGGFSVADGAGYVMIDDVGGLFAFGTARFSGSVPGLRAAGVPVGPAPVVGGFAV